MKWKQEPYRVGHGGYVSEFEQFLGGYLAGHPNVERDQQRGWYLLWDHRVDLADLEKQRKDAVPVPPYYYPE
jgi:hypothetical protein